MSYRVVQARVLRLTKWQGKWHIELRCRVEENDRWQKTKLWRYPYPCWFEDLEHDLMIYFDVGNVRLQQHLEYFIPHKNPQMQD